MMGLGSGGGYLDGGSGMVFTPTFGSYYGGAALPTTFAIFSGSSYYDPTYAQQQGSGGGTGGGGGGDGSGGGGGGGSGSQAGIVAGITKFGELRDSFLSGSTNGKFHYVKFVASGFTQTVQGFTTLGTPKVGSAEIRMDVDFGNRRIAGAGSQLTINTQSAGGNLNQTLSLDSATLPGSNNFENAVATGNVAFTVPSGLSGNAAHFAGTSIQFSNLAGAAANFLDTHIVYNDGGNAGSGDVNAATRTDGPLPQ